MVQRKFCTLFINTPLTWKTQHKGDFIVTYHNFNLLYHSWLKLQVPYKLMEHFPWNDSPSPSCSSCPLVHNPDNSAQTHAPLFPVQTGRPLPPLGLPLASLRLRSFIDWPLLILQVPLFQRDLSQPLHVLTHPTVIVCLITLHYFLHSIITTSTYYFSHVMFSLPPLSLTGSEIVSVSFTIQNPLSLEEWA